MRILITVPHANETPPGGDVGALGIAEYLKTQLSARQHTVHLISYNDVRTATADANRDHTAWPELERAMADADLLLDVHTYGDQTPERWNVSPRDAPRDAPLVVMPLAGQDIATQMFTGRPTVRGSDANRNVRLARDRPGMRGILLEFNSRALQDEPAVQRVVEEIHQWCVQQANSVRDAQRQRTASAIALRLHLAGQPTRAQQRNNRTVLSPHGHPVQHGGARKKHAVGSPTEFVRVGGSQFGSNFALPRKYCPQVALGCHARDAGQYQPSAGGYALQPNVQLFLVQQIQHAKCHHADNA